MDNFNIFPIKVRNMGYSGRDTSTKHAIETAGNTANSNSKRHFTIHTTKRRQWECYWVSTGYSGLETVRTVEEDPNMVK
jgi:hypothetical protein